MLIDRQRGKENAMYTYTASYYFARKDTCESCVRKYRDIKSIILSEKKHMWKVKYHMVSLYEKPKI